MINLTEEDFADPQKGMRRVLSDYSDEISEVYEKLKDSRMLILMVTIEGRYPDLMCGIEISPKAWENYLNHLPIRITDKWQVFPL
jgi:hypothetical protein